MELVQVEFSCAESQDVSLIKVVWVDASWDLKPGNLVTFKDDSKHWTVSRVYEIKIKADSLQSKWGLALPKSQRTER